MSNPKEPLYRPSPDDDTDLPNAFRVQVFSIIRRVFGRPLQMRATMDPRLPHPLWRQVRNRVRYELGRETLAGEPYEQLEAMDECKQFLLAASSWDALFLIHTAFFYIDCWVRNDASLRLKVENLGDVDEAIRELNEKLATHGLPYRWSHCSLQRTDSAYVSREVVKPAIDLLRTDGFEGAQSEFIQAHTYYLAKDHDNAIVHAVKAIESSLKVILSAHGWDYGPKDGVDKLIGLAMSNGLIPDYLREHFTGISKTLIAAPAIRNREPGVSHGGESIHIVPDHLTAFALHSAAAAIVFLVASHHELIRKSDS